VFTFTAQSVSAEVLPQTGHIQELELHSPRLNIDQVRELVSQLDETFGLDPKEFLSWCDKTGNRRIDIQAFSSKNSHSSNPTKIVGYSINQTFNNEKPLYVRFIMRDR
jgi:hypothetical protein